MPVKTILFLAAFVAACGGALYAPLVGVIAYMMHYQIGPESQWWAEPIRHWGIRYSYLLAVFTAVGIAINWRKLRYGHTLLTRHEWLLVAFVGLVWLSTILGLPAQSEVSPLDYPPLKLTKILIFVLMLTHVITTPRDLNILFWAFVAGAAFLGYQAYTAGPAMFAAGGRLDNIGGPDFKDSNAFAIYLAVCLPIASVQFLRSGWIGKLVCGGAGILATNAIVLTRSRGALVGLVAGLLFAFVLAPKGKRWLIALGIIVFAIGAYSLTDPGFWERAETLQATDGQWESSAQSRLDIWRGSLSMLWDHPLGVGARGFLPMIGEYVPEHPLRDAHSTVVLCYSELGIQGLVVFLLLHVSAYHILRKTYERSKALPADEQQGFSLLCYAVAVSLTIWAVSGLTVSLLYVEATWWLLAIPVLLHRAVDNLVADMASSRGQLPDNAIA